MIRGETKPPEIIHADLDDPVHERREAAAKTAPSGALNIPWRAPDPALRKVAHGVVAHVAPEMLAARATQPTTLAVPVGSSHFLHVEARDTWAIHHWCHSDFRHASSDDNKK